MAERRETYDEFSIRLLRSIADMHDLSYEELTAIWPPEPPEQYDQHVFRFRGYQEAWLRRWG